MKMGDDEIAVMGLPVEGGQGHHHARQASRHEDDDAVDGEQARRVENRPPGGERGDPGEDLQARRNRDRRAGGGERAYRHLRKSCRQHMMRPYPEAQQSRCDHGEDDQVVADEIAPGDGCHHHRQHGGGRQKDDVDLGMAEEPEKMLPKQGIAAPCGVEERPVQRVFQFQQQRAENHRGKAQDDHDREHQECPCEDRHLVEAHARRPRAQHADDEFDGPGDGRDFDEADAQQPEIGIDAGRVNSAGERRIHEPAAIGRPAHEQRCEEGQSADEVSPKGIGREPRKRQVAGAQHLWQQQHADSLDGGNGEEEHHHRAVHGEKLVIGFRREQRLRRRCELYPHHQGEDAGQQEKQERRAEIINADIIVADGGEIFPTLGRAPDFLQRFDFALGACAGGWKAFIKRLIESLLAVHRSCSR